VGATGRPLGRGMHEFRSFAVEAAAIRKVHCSTKQANARWGPRATSGRIRP
jgi:hypothetical protein